MGQSWYELESTLAAASQRVDTARDALMHGDYAEATVRGLERDVEELARTMAACDIWPQENQIKVGSFGA